MTPWYVISALGWVAWIWSLRYLFHTDCCTCRRCFPRDESWVGVGTIVGFSAMIALGFAGVILWDRARWLAIANMLTWWFWLAEGGEDGIFWSERRWLQPLRRWLYAR